MKKIIYVVLLFLNFTSYGQQVFEYEFDENITLNVLEETETAEIANGKYIRGTFENEVLIFLSSNKLKGKLGEKNETNFSKGFQGIKDGILKSTKGKIIYEENIKLNNVEISRSKIEFTLEGQNKIIDTYAFLYKEIIYTLQFMNNENEFDKLIEFRKGILNSIIFK
jgi:hypothetical protein